MKEGAGQQVLPPRRVVSYKYSKMRLPFLLLPHRVPNWLHGCRPPYCFGLSPLWWPILHNLVCEDTISPFPLFLFCKKNPQWPVLTYTSTGVHLASNMVLGICLGSKKPLLIEGQELTTKEEHYSSLPSRLEVDHKDLDEEIVFRVMLSHFEGHWPWMHCPLRKLQSSSHLFKGKGETAPPRASRWSVTPRSPVKGGSSTLDGPGELSRSEMFLELLTLIARSTPPSSQHCDWSVIETLSP